MPTPRLDMSAEEKAILQSVRLRYPKPAHLTVVRVNGADRQIIPSADGQSKHRVTWDDVENVERWLLNHPLMGPGSAYSVQVYVENEAGKIGKRAQHIMEIPFLVSPGQAAQTAFAQQQVAHGAMVDSARLSAVGALADVQETIAREIPVIQEAARMTASADPNQQVLANSQLAASMEKLTAGLGQFAQQAQGLQVAISRGPGFGQQPVAPVAAAAAPQTSAPLTGPFGGAPTQIVDVPGVGKFMLVNGQSFPVRDGQFGAAPPPPGTPPEVVALMQQLGEVRTKLAVYESGGGAHRGIDPGIQSQLDQLKATAAAAEARAKEAEARAERMRDEAERERKDAERQRESDRRFDALQAELKALREEKKGGPDATIEMMKWQSSQQLELQKLAAATAERGAEQVNILQREMLAMAREKPDQSEQMRRMTAGMGDILNVVTTSLAQATRIAAMGGPPAKDQKPLWADPLDKLLTTMQDFGMTLIGGQARPPGPQGQPQLPPPPIPPQLPAVVPQPPQIPSAVPQAQQLPPPPPPPQQQVQQQQAAPPAQSGPPAADVAEANGMLNAARIACAQGRMEEGFRGVYAILQRFPWALEKGEDELLAGRRLLAGYWPEGATDRDIVQALVNIHGPEVIQRLSRIMGPQPVPSPPAASQEPQPQQPPPPAADPEAGSGEPPGAQGR